MLEGHYARRAGVDCFTDPATGGLRLAGGSRDGPVRIWDLVAGGAALLVLEVGTRGLRADGLCGSGDGRGGSLAGRRTRPRGCGTRARAVRRCGWFLFDDSVCGLAVRGDVGGLFVASGKRWGELRI